VKPGDDFYKFADGGWMASHPIPPEYPRWGTFTILAEENTEKLHGILEDAASDQDAGPSSNTHKLGDFYSSGMDEDAINKAGFDPIKPELERIDAMRTSEDITREVARLHQGGIPVFFGYGSDQDAKNSSLMIADLHQGGLALPDRDYYLKTDDKSKSIQDAYVLHVAKMLTLLGETSEAAAADSHIIFNFEKTLAQNSRTRVQLRDPDTNYNPTSLEGVVQTAPFFRWHTYLRDIHAPLRGIINIGQPDYLKGLQQVWASTPLATIKAYMRWHLLNGTARYLCASLVDEDFEFKGKTLTGAQVNRPRWKRVVSEVDSSMGEALGQLYVAKYFPPAAKAKAKQMVANIRAALGDDLNTLSWMSPQTKEQARKKLEAFTEKIGYPDKWRDYSGLNVDRGPYVMNVWRAREFRFHYEINKIGHKVDRTEWGMTPPTVNAYYNPSMNEIVFPAGILQPPFFNPNADDAVNYGGIGAVIGHEMTHGFDDQGAKFDAQGNLRNWWTPEDQANFQQRVQRIVTEYDGFEAEPGIHENGKLEAGEALADLGGLTLSNRAFQKSLEGKPHPADIDGFTAEQRFFLGFAQVWATNVTPQYARLQVNTDPHPLAQFRVDGTVSNMPAFAQAWHLQSNDPMVLPEDKRCQIW
jgi:predicted metalloendopeptidase